MANQSWLYIKLFSSPDQTWPKFYKALECVLLCWSLATKISLSDGIHSHRKIQLSREKQTELLNPNIWIQRCHYSHILLYRQTCRAPGNNSKFWTVLWSRAQRGKWEHLKKTHESMARTCTHHTERSWELSLWANGAVHWATVFKTCFLDICESTQDLWRY